jgi:homoserine kinase
MSPKVFEIIVPGSTSNLGSGFDTISAALKLFLRIRVVPGPAKDIVWTGDIPEENILERAFLNALEFMGCEQPGLTIAVDNEIPLGRGLGSSGAAIVAGIKIAEHIACRSLTTEEVMGIAMPLEGHPENVAASLLGGWVISRSLGEKVGCETIQSALQCHFILAVPKAVVSTQKARQILPKSYSLEDTVFNLQRCALFIHALHTGNKTLLREATQDRIHQSYRARLVKGLGSLLELQGLPSRIQGRLLSLTISGSGPTMLALVDGEKDAVGSWMKESLRSRGTEVRIYDLALALRGAQLS